MNYIVSKMNWQQLQDEIYYLDGSLRDIYVDGTTRHDWIVWADFVNQNYKTSFYSHETDIKQDKINIHKAFEFWDRISEIGATATVFIDRIEINIHFFCEEEIENDITPTEICSIDDHLKLVDYIVKISKVLNKKVVLTPENSSKIELIAVNQEAITISAI